MGRDESGAQKAAEKGGPLFLGFSKIFVLFVSLLWAHQRRDRRGEWMDVKKRRRIGSRTMGEMLRFS
jgi:hypothetical protein